MCGRTDGQADTEVFVVNSFANFIESMPQTGKILWNYIFDCT
jgi:hypothetical protein